MGSGLIWPASTARVNRFAEGALTASLK